MKTISIVQQGGDVGDYVAKFRSARGSNLTTILSQRDRRERCVDTRLVVVDLLMKGKTLSHIRMPAGDHHHVPTSTLVEVA